MASLSSGIADQTELQNHYAEIARMVVTLPHSSTLHHAEAGWVCQWSDQETRPGPLYEVLSNTYFGRTFSVPTLALPEWDPEVFIMTGRMIMVLPPGTTLSRNHHGGWRTKTVDSEGHEMEFGWYVEIQPALRPIYEMEYERLLDQINAAALQKALGDQREVHVTIAADCSEAVKQLEEAKAALGRVVAALPVPSAPEPACKIGNRRVRVVGDGTPEHTKLLDCVTGEDLTEIYTISRIVMCVDQSGCNATVVFHGAEADVEGIVSLARTTEEQQDIIAANDAAVEEIARRTTIPLPSDLT